MKGMKNCLIASLLFLLLAVILTGCGGQKKTEFSIYLINGAEDGLVEGSYTLKSDESGDMVKELADLLNSRDVSAGRFKNAEFRSESGDTVRTPLLPEGVSIEQYSLNGGNLSLWFSKSYYDMGKKREVLCRDGIVQEMLQVPGVTSVTFYVGSGKLKGADGKEVGPMTADSFVTNPGNQVNSMKEATLTLFFADSKGTSLSPEIETVKYASSVSIEKLVVQQLIAGPDSSSLQATVPSDTKIINVMLSDGVCYVNLDSGFLSQSYSISPELTIYSIVDSLCQLDGVKKVQVSVNGSSDVVFRDKVDLSQPFTMNEDIISSDSKPVEKEVQQSDQ